MTTTTSDAVTITILGGTYAGQTWTGDLADAPVTMLIPEGIVSARTTEEATRQRTAIRAALEQRNAVEISAVRWALRVERVADAVTDDQIRALETSAAKAGDHAQVLICQIALGEVDLAAGPRIEAMRIGAFIDKASQIKIAQRFGTAETARAECARVIADAAAQS